MDHRRTRFIHEMGIGPVWKHRALGLDRTTLESSLDVSRPENKDVLGHASLNGTFTSEAAIRSVDGSNRADLSKANGLAPTAAEISQMNWEQLKENVAACIKCRLCETRTKSVFGIGDEAAGWLFVGEGPGRSEDAKGEPFVGPAGKLLDNMLLSMGLQRGQNAYIANTVKCRPIGQDGRDRPPAPDEAEACRPYLERQIDLIQPKIIVALGKTAAISLLGLPPDTPVTKLRGTVHQYRGLPLVVTYHPAYLLRKLSEKGKTWSDLCLAMRTYGDTSR